MPVEDLDQPGKVHQRAAETIDLVDHDDIDESVLDILAERLHRPATGTAFITRGENLIVAVQMFGQGLTAGLALLTVSLIGLIVLDRRRCRCPRDLFLFQCQFKLIKGFGARAKPMPPQTGQLMFELLDPVITLLDLCREDR